MRMSVNNGRDTEEVQGILLAQTSSRQFSHRHEGRYVTPGQRCSACRWTRITIIRDDKQERNYAVIQEGFSLVPGEFTVGKVQRTSSPLWVIKCLHRRNKEKQEYLSIVARNALLMATEYDKGLAEECERRGIG